MKQFIKGLFTDGDGRPSSKRFIGISCGLMLTATLFANQFTAEHIKPSDTLVECVTALAFGCLGLTSLEKFKKS